MTNQGTVFQLGNLLGNRCPLFPLPSNLNHRYGRFKGFFSECPGCPVSFWETLNRRLSYNNHALSLVKGSLLFSSLFAFALLNARLTTLPIEPHLAKAKPVGRSVGHSAACCGPRCHLGSRLHKEGQHCQWCNTFATAMDKRW